MSAVPSIQLQPLVRTGTCGVCGEGLERRPTRSCGRCDASLHRECWAMVGRCGTYACEEPALPRLSRLPRPRPDGELAPPVPWGQVRRNATSRERFRGPRSPADPGGGLSFLGTFGAATAGEAIAWILYFVLEVGVNLLFLL